MRRDVLLATLLCMLTLAGAVRGAGFVEDEPRQVDPAFAPVQVVIDAVPDVVRLAIAEARRDLSPDDAEALAERLDAFAQGLDRPGRHAPGTVADEEQAATTYPFAVTVARAAQDIPGAIADVERAGSSCAHWSGNATTADARQWERWLAQGGAKLARSQAALTALAADAPEPLDPGPLLEAAALHRQWAETTYEDVEACVVVLLTSMTLEPQGARAPGQGYLLAASEGQHLWARLLPTEAWPTQHVVVDGLVSGSDGLVTVRSEGLGWRATAPVTAGAFHLVLPVPADAQIGTHDVAVAHGPAALSLELVVVPAPTELQLRVPRQVQAGSTFQVRALLETPAPALVPSGATVRLDGDLDGALRTDGTPVTFQAPGVPGNLTGTASFGGTDRLQAAHADYHIQVVALPSGGTEGGPLPRDGTTGGLAEGAVLWGILLALLLLAAASGIVWRRRRASGDAPLEGPETWVARPAPTGTAPAGGTAWLQTTLLQTMAALHTRLRRMGLLRRRDSVRDLAARARGWGWDLRAAATRFESVRYGGGRETPEEGRRLARWLQRRMGKEGM